MDSVVALPETRRVVKGLHCSKSSLVQLVDLNTPAFLAVVKTRLQFSVPFDQEVNIHSTLAKASTYFPRLYFSDSERKIMVLEYCESGSLIEVTQNQTHPKEVDTAFQFMLQLVEAVRIMHGKRIVHRDIQPYHILLGKQMTPKITGFGKAKFISGSEEGKEFKEDIFNLGKTLFVGLTGDVNVVPTPEAVLQGLQRYPEIMRKCIHLMISNDQSKRISAQGVVEMLKSGKLEMSFPPLTEDTEEGKPDLSIILKQPDNESRSKDLMMTGGTNFDSKEISMEWSPTCSVKNPAIAIIAKKPLSDDDLVSKLENIFSRYSKRGGNFIISLATDLPECNGVCGGQFPSVDLVHLDTCEHLFCRLCMNQILKQAISYRNKYSNIKCPICQVPFEPLSDSIAKFLDENLKVELDELMLEERAIHCPNPNCGIRLEIESLVGPQNQMCPICEKKFCTYCFGGPHLFRCSLYRSRRKLKA